MIDKRFLTLVVSSIMIMNEALPTYAAEGAPFAFFEGDSPAEGSSAASLEDLPLEASSAASPEDVPDDSSGAASSEDSSLEASSAASPEEVPDEGSLAASSEDSSLEASSFASSEDPASDSSSEASLDASLPVDFYKDYPTGYLAVNTNVTYESVTEGEETGRLFGSAVLQKTYITPNLPDLRDQSPYGTCWAFATNALAEINLQKKGYNSIDLSELHLAYFGSHFVNDPLNGFGNPDQPEAGTLSLNLGGRIEQGLSEYIRGIGPATEAVASYEKDAALVDSAGLDDNIAYEKDAYIKDYYVEQINVSDLTPIKQLIVDHGGVAVAFAAKSSMSSGTSEEVYSVDNNCYYNPRDELENHAVVIVGWDDSFSRDKFVQKPKGDGAFLVRNSWTSGSFEDNEEYAGYFWMSYYEASLGKWAYAAEFTLEKQYDNNYQYMQSVLPYYTNCLQGANFYTAHSEGGCYGEKIKAVGFDTNSSNLDLKIDIYTDVDETEDLAYTSPISSTVVRTDYAGFHTATLDQPVIVGPGEEFAVVVSDMSGSNKGFGLAVEDVTVFNYKGKFISFGISNSGRSYDIGVGSDEWRNSADLDIKVYTDNVSREEIDDKPEVLTDLKIDCLAASFPPKKGDVVGLSVTPIPIGHDISGEVKWSVIPEDAGAIEGSMLRLLKAGKMTVSAEAEGVAATKELAVFPVAADFTYEIGDDNVITLKWDHVPGAGQYIVSTNDSSFFREIDAVQDCYKVVLDTFKGNSGIDSVSVNITTVIDDSEDTVNISIPFGSEREDMEYDPVTSITLSSKSIKMGLWQKGKLEANILPYTANDTVIYSSNKPLIVRIDEEDMHSGVFTAVGVGTAVITATAHGGKTARCTVTVGKAVSTLSLAAKGGASSVAIGKNLQMVPVFNMGDKHAQPLNKAVIYEIVDDGKLVTGNSVAAINQKGVLKGLGEGVVTVRAMSTTDKDQATGEYIYADKKIYVYSSLKSAALDRKSLTMAPGGRYKLSVNIKSLSGMDYVTASYDAVSGIFEHLKDEGTIRWECVPKGALILTDNNDGTCIVTAPEEPLTSSVTVKAIFKTFSAPGEKASMDKTVSCKVTVKEHQYLTSLTIKPASISMNRGEDRTVSISLNPMAPAESGVNWVIADKTVSDGTGYRDYLCFATGDAKEEYFAVTNNDIGQSVILRAKRGAVIPKGKLVLKGAIEIKAVSKGKNGKEIRKTIDVTIGNQADSIVITKNRRTVKSIENYPGSEPEILALCVKKSFGLKAAVYTDNDENAVIKAGNQKVVWESNNKSVATVSASGKVTGVSNGFAVITARSVSDRSVTASVKVGVYTEVSKLTLEKNKIYMSTSFSGSGHPSYGQYETVTALITPDTVYDNLILKNENAVDISCNKVKWSVTSGSEIVELAKVDTSEMRRKTGIMGKQAYLATLHYQALDDPSCYIETGRGESLAFKVTGAGTVKLIARAGSKKATCTVTIYSRTTGIELFAEEP